MAKPKKYQEAEIPAIDDALGITEEKKKEVEEGIKESFGIDDFLDAHRAAIDMLEETDKHLEEYVSEYKKKKDDREPVEAVYTLKIAILLSMAKRFHPLSAYGKSLLDDASLCRNEFERKVGPLVTRITENNIDLFKTVLSEDVSEDIITGRISAIGAVRTKKKTAYGVGALAYYLDDMTGSGDMVLRIKWLFVNRDFRERGVADHLIGEITGRAAKAGVENISVEFPTNVDDKNLMGYLFGTWHFDLDSGLNPDAVMRVGDVTGYGKIESYRKGAEALSSLGKKGGLLTVKKTLRGLGYTGYLSDPELPDDYIDQDLSCFVSTGDAVKAILLAHRTPSGTVRVDHIGFALGSEALVYNLVSFFVGQAVMICEDDTMLELPVEMEEIGELIEEICPKQMGQYLVAGNLTKPSPEMDFTPEDIDELMAV